jgi:hypothetical protein
LYIKIMKKLVTILSISLSFLANSQCNTNITICQSGVAGPFNFGAGSGAVSTCLDWMGSSQFTYITLYITQSGPLNLYIDGNGATGYLDVAIFNIPSGVSPCVAIQNTANQIGCNYASASGGCNQFGNVFPCTSSVPAPFVTAGQVLMIVVEDWMNGSSTNFTLQLGPAPGAQTGPPNTTINPVGPFCTTNSAVQLTAANGGGVWSGPGVSPSGLFNPSVAGPGTHIITYSLGSSPCNSSSTTQITVNAPPTLNPIVVQPVCYNVCNGSANANVTGATYLWTPGNFNTQTISNLCPGTYNLTVNQNGCISTTSVTITNPPQINLGSISHN